MYSAIVFLPLLGFLIAGVFGRFIGARACEWITTSLLFVCALLSWIGFKQIALDHAPPYEEILTSWISVGTFKANWALYIDALTAVMLVVVTTVSALVHLYSIGYMADDPSRPRFFAYLSLFTFAMLMLVTSNNLIQLFFGWEGVGLASYLLIGFWYQKPSANAAAIKAFVVNRVGDFGFALGICLVFAMTQSISFETIFLNAPQHAHEWKFIFGGVWDLWTLACLLLFLGAMGKSAQFLLHVWLPDAMEGPTPVSALIHAATMVTAGVFMVARLSPLFALSPTALTVITLVGATTAIFAATVGLVQNDIKRVVAYSTCSQLGYMFVALGLGGYSMGVFHLFTHAFFKALLFLGAGCVIVATHHEQDMRKMGGLWKSLPFTCAMMIIGTLALTGFPFTSGYYSKDPIIEAAFAVGKENWTANYAFLMTLLSAGLTSFYSWRLIFMTFFGAPHETASLDHAHTAHDVSPADAHVDHHTGPIHEPVMTMLIPLVVLAVGALFAGGVFHQDFIGHGMDEFWRNSLVSDDKLMHAVHSVPDGVKFATLAVVAVGFFFSFWMYIIRPSAPRQLANAFPSLYEFLLHQWYFNELYDALFVRPAFKIGRWFWKVVDGEIIDGLGPNGVARTVEAVTNKVVVRLQTGYLYQYALVMLIGVAGILTWYCFALGGGH